MVTLTKIDGSKITVNSDEIEFIEAAHDSRVIMKSGLRIIVSEPPEDIIEKIIQYKRMIYQNSNALPELKKEIKNQES